MWKGLQVVFNFYLYRQKQCCVQLWTYFKINCHALAKPCLFAVLLHYSLKMAVWSFETITKQGPRAKVSVMTVENDCFTAMCNLIFPEIWILQRWNQTVCFQWLLKLLQWEYIVIVFCLWFAYVLDTKLEPAISIKTE